MSEPTVLAVAGSDPSGGAGIQADLKTATALGVYAAAVLTSLTAQNTTGVQGIHPVPADFVAAQIRSVVTDLDVRAVKTGMLGDASVVAAVADELAGLAAPLVLDPVTVATSGDVLVPEDAVAGIAERLLPLATVVTPNLPEARLLTGLALPGDDPEAELAAAGHALLDAGASYALVKGGHLSGDRVVDVLVGPNGVTTLAHDRVPGPNTHGTGCTLSSAVAARLAVGDTVSDAVRTARDFLQRALRGAVGRTYGAGHGPVDHLVDLR